MTRGEAVPSEVWHALVGDEGTVARYWGHVWHRRVGCWYWLGAISANGYGKYRAGTRGGGSSRVVSAHVFGYRLAHGAPFAGTVIGHRCDEAACQNPSHLEAITVARNTGDWSIRRHRDGGPLADVRGAAGRAVAIRDAILAAAAAAAAAEDVEVAITAATTAGHSHQERLF